MSTTNGKCRITRRAFLELSSGALASTGLVCDANAARTSFDRSATVQTAKSDAVRMTGKIALEEHFGLPESANYAGKDLPTPEDRTNFFDLGSRRIADMDRGDLDICILSLGAPGVQAVPDISKAIELSRRANDFLAENIARNPKRLKGFAALPLQDPQAAARELTRCVKELGFCGALVNGFSQSRQCSTICPNTVLFGQPSKNWMCPSTSILVSRWLHGSKPTKDTRGSPVRLGVSRSKLQFTPCG
jgi:hypothetical protein